MKTPKSSILMISLLTFAAVFIVGTGICQAATPAIASGSYHTIALKSDGTLWAWGYNGDGQLGDGTTIYRRSPVQIGTDIHWAQIAAGNEHTIALKSDGSLWAWGNNFNGELGEGPPFIVIPPYR